MGRPVVGDPLYVDSLALRSTGPLPTHTRAVYLRRGGLGGPTKTHSRTRVTGPESFHSDTGPLMDDREGLEGAGGSCPKHPLAH